MRERLLFIKRFIASPLHLGSITPSSVYLCRTLLGLADVSQARYVVELGPGTGPITSALLSGMPADGRLLAVERDPSLAGHLRSRFQDQRLTVVTGDAQALRRHLAENGFPARVPLIVSGLPFTSLPGDVRERILQAVASALSPGGDFLLYQYSTAIRRKLLRHFSHVTSRIVLRNVPPAVCMRCRPRDGDRSMKTVLP